MSSISTRFLALLLVLPGIAHASILTSGDVVQLRRYSSGAYETYGGASGGGEFALFKKQVDGTYDYLAKTFCIEYDERVILNTDILVGAVSDRSALGGSNTDQGDLVGKATEFLYSAFATGSLGAFDLGGGVFYNAASDLWSNALQLAIWNLEEEVSGFGQRTYSDEAKLLHDFALSETSSWLGVSGSVKALNLFRMGTNLNNFDPLDWTTYQTNGRHNKHRQDQLWYVAPTTPPPPPPPPSDVPEPGSICIWLLVFGSFGFGWMRRRKRNGNG